MDLTFDYYQPGRATIDGPALIDRSLDEDEQPATSEKELFSGSRLRYFGAPQTAIARHVRPRRRRAVILGLEGALVDTREASTLSWLVALHDGGHDVSVDLLRHLSGVSATELLRIVAGISADSTEGRNILRQQDRIFRTWYLPRILPFVGARRLLQRMKSDGLRVIALSGGSADAAPELVRASGVADLLDDVVAADGEPRDAVLNEVITSVITLCGCKRDGVADAEPFDEGRSPFREVDGLVALRDALVHGRHEWRDSHGRRQNLERRLRAKFPHNALAKEGDPEFPDQLLGAGCAMWAVRVAEKFSNEFCQRMAIPTRGAPRDRSP